MQERKRLEDIIKELPEDLRKEFEDFAHYLWEKRRKKIKVETQI
jgi:intein-encoded DNA endonuclease-like protein